MGIWNRYVGVGSPPSKDAIRSSLWTPGALTDLYDDDRQTYQAALLDQYKLAVEMADRVSARRALANTFFLTLNALVFTLIGVFWKDRPEADEVLLLVPMVPLITQCMAWFWILRSYRQLNAGKFAVIGEMERRLPARPYSDAEWKALGQGADKELYWPLTHVEMWVPLVFAATYLVGVTVAITTYVGCYTACAGATASLDSIGTFSEDGSARSGAGTRPLSLLSVRSSVSTLSAEGRQAAKPNR